MGWEQLADIAAGNAVAADAERAAPLAACPDDGEPLDRGPAGPPPFAVALSYIIRT